MPINFCRSLCCQLHIAFYGLHMTWCFCQIRMKSLLFNLGNHICNISWWNVYQKTYTGNFCFRPINNICLNNIWQNFLRPEPENFCPMCPFWDWFFYFSSCWSPCSSTCCPSFTIIERKNFSGWQMWHLFGWLFSSFLGLLHVSLGKILPIQKYVKVL